MRWVQREIAGIKEALEEMASEAREDRRNFISTLEEHQEKPHLLICEIKFRLVRINGHQTDADLYNPISSDKFMVGSHSVSFQLIWHKSASISL